MTGRTGNATPGRRRSATTTRGNNATIRGGRNATIASGGQSSPVTNERMTLPATLMGKIEAAQATTTDEVRTELATTQEGVAVADERSRRHVPPAAQ